jgi:hypothetical protein
MSERYLEIADKFHLLVTGGSDCHGFSKGKPLIGTVKLPYEHVEKLKARRPGAESRTPERLPLRLNIIDAHLPSHLTHGISSPNSKPACKKRTAKLTHEIKRIVTRSPN